MKKRTTSKCLHCKELFTPDYRNRDRQRHCPKPACRKAAKAKSQAEWLARPENENYFRAPENSRRVQEWRKAHPGYWRKKTPEGAIALQEACTAQAPGNEPVAPAQPPHALQEVCLMQPAVLVGLISAMTGFTLQEDIAQSARSFLARGQDILGAIPGAPIPPVYEEQAHPPSRSAPACAAAV